MTKKNRNLMIRHNYARMLIFIMIIMNELCTNAVNRVSLSCFL